MASKKHCDICDTTDRVEERHYSTSISDLQGKPYPANLDLCHTCELYVIRRLLEKIFRRENEYNPMNLTKKEFNRLLLKEVSNKRLKNFPPQK